MGLRFDVIYDSHGAHLDRHFCREWTDGEGCYGTNPDHGFTFDEAKEHVAKWYEDMAEYWRKLTLTEWEHGG